MPRAVLTPHLQRFFPSLPHDLDVAGGTLREVITDLEQRWPGLGFYVTDEQGRLRKHVAVWIDGRRVQDRERLSDPVGSASEIHILQALSGG